jgi:hypothetical protein
MIMIFERPVTYSIMHLFSRISSPTHLNEELFVTTLYDTLSNESLYIFKKGNISTSSSSRHGLGESPVPACSIVVSLSIVFFVYLCLVFRTVDIYMPVVECGYVPFFADVLSIYSCILLFFAERGNAQLISYTFVSYLI